MPWRSRGNAPRAGTTGNHKDLDEFRKTYLILINVV